ncbi:MAG: homocysteine S-methyltransferase family protein [Bacteroidota bacterium]|jgi:homocysteine S-methyltransferase|nr:homocysteine S-methyltransferase family protein [Bacteroidota bacterium]
MLLSEFLAQRSPLIMDGATGTELLRAGIELPAPLWSATALLRAPHVVRNIHYHYLHAGADIITTNTFRSNLRALRKAGMEDRWEEVNLRAVQLAFEARERYRPARPVLIAGGLAPVEDCYRPEDVPPRDELREEHHHQAGLLATFGVDILLVETMMTIREAEAAAEACARTGKEFMVSFVTDATGRLLSGEAINDAVHAVLPFAPTALLVNCVAASDMRTAFRALRASTTLPVGCYANTGNPDSVEDTDIRRDTDIAGFVEASRGWVDDGARLIGGCCGTTPEYIEALTRRHVPETLTTQKAEIEAWFEERYGTRSTSSEATP